MSALQVTLKRSPRSLIVGDHTITIEFAREEMTPLTEAGDVTVETVIADSYEDSANSAESPESSTDASAVMSETTDAAQDNAAEESPPQTHALPTSVATVITDLSSKIMTPLGLSNAVPVLSGATHDVITAEEVGFGGVSEEELADLKQMLAQTSDLVVELQEQHRQSLHEMQEVAVELATAAASWLTGVALDRNEYAVDDLIRQALHRMEADQPVRVRLNPADHELLKSLIRDPTSRHMLENVSVFDDAAMARGSCRVESGRRILLTDMNSRLDEIRRSWMEKLDDSQVERRGDGSTSRTLRRFPERRETA